MLSFQAVERVAYNFSLVILVVFFYYLAQERLSLSEWKSNVFLGLGFGATTAVSMFLSVPIFEGVILDSKMVLGVLAGLFGGVVPALITAGIASATRVAIGGVGTVPGIVGLVLSVAVGVALRRPLARAGRHRFLFLLLAPGIAAMSAQNLAALVFIPLIGAEATAQILRLTFLPSILVFIPAAAAISSMIAFVQDRSRAHAEVLSARLELEARVRQRTAQLEAARDKVVLAEKLASLGQLTAGIAHGLNTPLAVILSANRMLVQDLQVSILPMVQVVASMTPRQTRAFEALAGACITANPQEVTRTERRKLLALLEGTSVAGMPRLADLIGEFGLTDLQEELSVLLEMEDAVAAAATLADLGRMRRSTVMIERATENATAVVGALQEYARTEADDLVENVEIRRELDHVLRFFDHRIRGRVEVVVQEEQGVVVQTVPQALRHIWMILISNALDAMPAGGVLRILAESRRDYTYLAVEDSGSGVPEGLREKIFAPLFTTKSDGAGLGLGLDICRRTVERLGGKIQCVSAEDGAGARFEIKLPCRGNRRVDSSN